MSVHLNIVFMQLVMLCQLQHHQQQMLTNQRQPQQVLSLTSLRRRSYWQHPCLVTAAAAGLRGSGGSLPIMLHPHMPTKQQLLSQLLQLLGRQPLLRSLLLLICCWAWTPRVQHLLHQHLQVPQCVDLHFECEMAISRVLHNVGTPVCLCSNADMISRTHL